MTFYSKMAWNYEGIFPVSDMKLSFVKKRLEAIHGARILDVGCATGQFPYLLAKSLPTIQQVDAFDLDKDMIDLAKERYPHERINYRQGNMLELDVLYSTSYDMVTCFGNTLVHIGDENVRQFFASVYKRLNRGGMFILQLLNYHYVMEHNIRKLPLIETDVLRFERRYEEVSRRELTFATSLYMKESGETIEGSIPLYPVYREDIVRWLNDVGFQEVQCYKNYIDVAYDGEGLPLIITASK